MLERLTGREAVSARQLALETGMRQQTLSRWLQDACSVPVMPSQRPKHGWSFDEKLLLLNEASRLTGAELTRGLQREGVLLAEFEQMAARLSGRWARLDEHREAHSGARARTGPLAGQVKALNPSVLPVRDLG